MYTIRVYEKDTDDEWIFMKVADLKLAREIQHGLEILYMLENLNEIRGVYVDVEK